MALGHLDWVIIGLYMADMLAIGFWAMRKIKDCGGYMLGERKLRKWMMIAALFSGGISSSHPLSVASANYQKGFSGAWISLAYMYVMPFYWMFPPVFRRARLVTMVDFLRLRYGRIMEVLYNVVSVFGGAIFIGLGIETASVTINVISGGAISET